MHKNTARALRPAAVAVALTAAMSVTSVTAQQLQSVPAETPTKSQAYQPQFDKSKQRSYAMSQQQTDQVRFIVELEAPAAARYHGGIKGLQPTSLKATGASQLDLSAQPVQDYQQYLQRKQSDTFRAMQVAVPNLAMVQQLSLTFNGFIVEGKTTGMSADEMRAQLASVPGVKKVYADRKYYASTSTSMDTINAPAVWAQLGGQASAGRNIKVAIIDSGIDNDHPMFTDSGHPAVARPTKADYCTTTPSFCNDKLIVARWYEPVGTVNAGETMDPRDFSGHGTHVAGTAVGNPVNATIDGISMNLSGVAPGAHLMVYKALFADESGTGSGSTSQLLGALEDAVADGADIINNSWGGGPGGHPDDSPYREAFAAAREAGVLTVTAAGNDGPGDQTIGCPACIEDGLAVANSQHGRVITNPVDAAGLTGIDSNVGSGSFTIDAAITGPLALASNVDANLACNAYAANAFDGEIVLVQRGKCNFSVKADNLQAAGAIAMIVYNNEAGQLNMNVGTATLPSVSVSQADGQAIAAAWSASATATINTATMRVDEVAEDSLAASSSRGPNGDSSFLKPDITAPGSNILSSVPDDSIGSSSGTSMASPHVAGAAALLLAQRNTLTPEQLKSILMTSSVAGVKLEDQTTLATAFGAGAGRLDVERAADTVVVVDQPSLVNNSCVLECSFDVQFTNTGNSEVSVSTNVSFDGEGISGAFDVAQFNLAAGASQTVTLDVDSRFASEQWQFGEVTATVSNHPDMRMPIVVQAARTDDASVITTARTTSAPVINTPFSMTATGALGHTGEPVTFTVQVPDGASVVDGSIVWSETRSTPTEKGLNAEGTAIVWQGSQTNGADTTTLNASTGQIFAGQSLEALLGAGGYNSVCAAGCDDTSYAFPVGNYGGVVFDGVNYSHVTLSSNGVAGVGERYSTFDNTAYNDDIPNASEPNGLWAPFWTDLEMGTDVGGGQMNYAVVNDGTNDWFVWEWADVREYDDDSGTRYTFALWFKLGTDEVYFNYVDVGTEAPQYLTIGAESMANAFGTIGVQRFFDGAGNYVADGDVYLAKVARGEKASVTVDFDLVVDTIGVAPDRFAEAPKGDDVQVDLTGDFASVARNLVTVANITSGDFDFNAIAADVIEASGNVTLEVVSQPGNGSVTLVGEREFLYTPADNSAGTDSFTYRGVDANDNATSTGTIEVNMVNQAPVVSIDAISGSQSAGTEVDLDASASSDADDDELTFSWAQTGGSAVTLSNANTAVASFTVPELSQSANLTFEVTVSDGTATTTDTVSVTVQAYTPPSEGGSGGGSGGSFGVLLALLALPLAMLRRLQWSNKKA